jgi:serine/threonine protein kinase
VAEGLQAIHEVGIIHRDLKTPNLMRDARGIVRLMDFGIAKGSEETGTGGLTMTGAVMGTPEYMSPEQCLGERIDFRSDIYAAGIVTFETFTGQVPFKGDTPVATLFKHIQDQVPLEGQVAARIPIPLVPVIRRALHKNRADRFASAQEMAAALREAHAVFKVTPASDQLRTGPVPAGSTPTPARERRRDTRTDIYANFKLRRMDSQGNVLQEERTIAENVGRGGARVMTTMASLGTGDVVFIEEVGGPKSNGGPYSTRAEIRNSYLGKDNIRRLNLKFLDRPAPKHLVVEEDTSTSKRM